MNEILETENLLKTAQLGSETEKFLSTELGKHLQRQSEIDLENGFIEFLNADPTDTKLITRIQNQCLLAMKFKTWIDDAINAGQLAIQELHDYDD